MGTYAVRDAGSGGRYSGRNSATLLLRVRIEYGQPIRSAIAVAGIRGRSGEGQWFGLATYHEQQESALFAGGKSGQPPRRLVCVREVVPRESDELVRHADAGRAGLNAE
jgi:hypothetical protein